MKAARRVFSVFTFRNVNTMTNNKLELKSTQQAFIIVLSQLVKTDCHTLLFICFCHSNFTDFTLNNTFFTLDIQYLTMRFKSGSNCSINNLGFSEAADAVFATLLRITGKLFPIIKVADIRYTAEIRTLYHIMDDSAFLRELAGTAPGFQDWGFKVFPAFPSLP
jgi:hypothetical protein